MSLLSDILITVFGFQGTIGLKTIYNEMQKAYHSLKKSGSHLLSHTVSNTVPSAAYVLTIVFGMGTGVSHKRIATRNFVQCLVSARKMRFWQSVLAQD